MPGEIIFPISRNKMIRMLFLEFGCSHEGVSMTARCDGWLVGGRWELSDLYGIRSLSPPNLIAT